MAHHANANACELGPAAGRQRFLNPLAVDQGTFRQSVGQSKALPKHERFSAACKARSERGIWQRRFWEHMIRDEAMTRDMSNIAISIRSSTDWSRVCAIGLTPRFRPIGAAKSKRSVSSASNGKCRMATAKPLFRARNWGW